MLNDEKELAEHTMLVDLGRNDIGRVCDYGTVKVKELMEIKRFSHVQHIVTHVVGKLNEKNDMYDAFEAVFPAGTVSGAPKVRAMEIIQELEPTQRETYAGAVGYFHLTDGVILQLQLGVFLPIKKEDLYRQVQALYLIQLQKMN